MLVSLSFLSVYRSRLSLTRRTLCKRVCFCKIIAGPLFASSWLCACCWYGGVCNLKVAPMKFPVWGNPKILIFCRDNLKVASSSIHPERGAIYCILLCRLSISYKNRCSDVTHAWPMGGQLPWQYIFSSQSFFFPSCNRAGSDHDSREAI